METTTQKNKLSRETKQVGKFGLVGILNTLIDFGIFNALTVYGTLPIILANVVSTTVAMSFSFVANKQFVFGSKSKDTLRQAALFLVVTAVGLYVLQNGIIYALTELWRWPLELGYDLVSAIGLGGAFSEEFVTKNGAKAIGTVFSMVWNYVLYKRIVFKK